MRTSDDKQKTDGTTSSSSSSSKSCVVENEIINNDNNNLLNNETVMVNNCVNIDLNANISAQSDSAKETLILVNNEIEIKQEQDTSNQIILDSNVKCDEIVKSLLDGLKDEINESIDVDDSSIDDENDKNEINVNKNDKNDDDTFASSKYSDVSFNRCEMSTSTSSLNSHVAAHNQYTPNRDNNRNHRRAVRKNFSLWIGVTSCVWACLVWLMKNYAN